MRAALTVALFAVTGCSSAAPQIKVADIIANCESYKGKSVQAAGYLGQCEFEGCFLAANKARWRQFERAWTSFQELSRVAEQNDLARAASKRLETLWPLGFKSRGGAGDAFIRKAEPLQHSYVVVTGTISKDGCTGFDDASHSFGIEPTDIRAWTVSEGAPANTN